MKVKCACGNTFSPAIKAIITTTGVAMQYVCPVCKEAYSTEVQDVSWERGCDVRLLGNSVQDNIPEIYTATNTVMIGVQSITLSDLVGVEAKMVAENLVTIAESGKNILNAVSAAKKEKAA